MLPNDDKLLREIEEVANLMGQSNEYVRTQCRNQKIKASKIGKRWYIPQHEVDRLLMLNPNETFIKSELQIAKLVAENKAIRSQLEAVKSLLGSANHLLEHLS